MSYQSYNSGYPQPSNPQMPTPYPTGQQQVLGFEGITQGGYPPQPIDSGYPPTSGYAQPSYPPQAYPDQPPFNNAYGGLGSGQAYQSAGSGYPQQPQQYQQYPPSDYSNQRGGAQQYPNYPPPYADTQPLNYPSQQPASFPQQQPLYPQQQPANNYPSQPSNYPSQPSNYPSQPPANNYPSQQPAYSDPQNNSCGPQLGTGSGYQQNYNNNSNTNSAGGLGGLFPGGMPKVPTSMKDLKDMKNTLMPMVKKFF